MTVSALFVDAAGVYPQLLGDEHCWCTPDSYFGDARTYACTAPVVAHPPCNLWVNMAAVNYARATAPCELCGGSGDGMIPGWECSACDGTGRREPNRTPVLPAWYPGGNDGGCFASALASVRRCGGVLEHPAGSHAWEKYGLRNPNVRRLPGAVGWLHYETGHWVCEVWQSAYGHAARKRTWLYYVGKRPPFELDWRREPGTHQVGWFDRNKPTLGKREASATPRAFADALIRLAEWSRGEP